MAYVSVEHEPDFWVDAYIEKEWKREGRWRLGCYYFVDTVQFYRVFDADQVRPIFPVEGSALAEGEVDDRSQGRHTGGVAASLLDHEACKPAV
jgi:hypothetical protein